MAKNILIVDDAAFMRMMIKDILTKNGYNVVCRSPFTETLLHNIQGYLIPPLVKCNSHYKEIHIESECISEWEGGSEVGAGISLGVDSTHSICKYFDSNFDGFRLTRLCNICCSGGSYNRRVFKQMVRMSDHVGIPIVNVTSNTIDVFRSGFYNLHHTFYNIASILSIGRMFKTYYYSSSGHDCAAMSFKEPPNFDSCVYDPLSTAFFSTRALRFYSEGADLNRDGKLIDISRCSLRRFINPCWNISLVNHACMWCDKCKRTIIELYSLDLLDQFNQSFDLEEFESFKDIYLLNAYVHRNSDYYKEAIERLSARNPELIQRMQSLSVLLDWSIEDPILDLAIKHGSGYAGRLYVLGLMHGHLGGVSVKKDVEMACDVARKLYRDQKTLSNLEVLINALSVKKDEDSKKEIVSLYSDNLGEPSKLVVAKAWDALGQRARCVEILRGCSNFECRHYLASRLRWGPKESQMESIEILEDLSSHGFLDARGSLAINYHDGIIVERNLDRAIDLMRSAQSENWCRKYLLSYLFERGTAQDLSEIRLICHLYGEAEPPCQQIHREG